MKSPLNPPLSYDFPMNYFTSCDPHHDIYTFCYWQIFWHSIWHFIWHSIWHTFWHSIWHIFWHSIGISSGILSGILSGKHSGTLSGIPSGILSGISSGILSGILSGISSGILPGICSGISSGILSGISSGILPGRWGPAVHTGPRLRSSGAHWAGQLPGWGPAVHTELGSSQVEVQQCTLSWAARRLRSSGAHWAGKLAKSLAKSWQGGSGHGSGGRGGGGGETGGGGGGRGEGGGGRGEGGGGGGSGGQLARRRRTVLIKTNNPHLAGGEKYPFPTREFSASHVLTTRLPVLNTAASYDGNAAWRALGLASPKVAGKRDGSFLK